MSAPVEPCRCDAPGKCPRFAAVFPEMSEHLFGKCKGTTCTPAESDGFRAYWDTLAAKTRTDVLGPCRYFTESPLKRDGCGSCQGKWVYPCDVYGTCSPVGFHVGVKRCVGCVHRTARDSDAGEPDVKYLKLTNSMCPGDVLVMTAAIESLHASHPGRFVTAYEGTAPELFDYNPHVVKAVESIDGRRVAWEEIKMQYPLIDKCDERPVHFMEGYCDFLSTAVKRRVPLTVNRPHLYLSDDERGWMNQVHEVTGANSRYWLVNAGYKDDYPAKWWGASNYQRVVDLLRGKVMFVQIGETGHTHPALTGVLDLRGKTDIRQLVRLAYHAAGGVGPSTFLQHLCAAWQKPYVCIAGGREPLAWQHYPRQATLSTIGVTPCSRSRQGQSCWKDRTTFHPDKPRASVCELPMLNAGGEMIPTCLESIRPERVAAEIEARYTNSTAVL